MNPMRARKLARSRLEASLRFGHLNLAINVLGYASIGHITGGALMVAELTGHAYIVRVRQAGPYCVTCKSDKDDHASLVRLYLARIGKHGLGA